MKVLHSAREMVFLHPKVRFLGASLGLTIFFIAFSLLHEKLVKTEYSLPASTDDDGYAQRNAPHKEHFYYFQTLLAVLCLVSAIVARVCHKVFEEKPDTTSVPLYLCNSFVYVLVTLCSSYALKWVSYPVQIIAKCASPIPTLVLSVLIGKCTYKWHKYVFTVLLVAGVSLFMYDSSKLQKGIQESLWYGEILLAVSLLMDGFCGGIQDRIRHTSDPPPFSMMCKTNFFAALFVIIGAITMNEVTEFLAFVQRYPHVLATIGLLTVTNVIGQMFVYAILTTSGSLACSYVTTVRKLFSILLSVILFGHTIVLYQWVGFAVTFGVLFLDTIYSDTSGNNRKVSDVAFPHEVGNDNAAYVKEVVIPIEAHDMANCNGKSLS